MAPPLIPQRRRIWDNESDMEIDDSSFCPSSSTCSSSSDSLSSSSELSGQSHTRLDSGSLDHPSQVKSSTHSPFTNLNSEQTSPRDQLFDDGSRPSKRPKLNISSEFHDDGDDDIIPMDKQYFGSTTINHDPSRSLSSSEEQISLDEQLFGAPKRYHPISTSQHPSKDDSSTDSSSFSSSEEDEDSDSDSNNNAKLPTPQASAPLLHTQHTRLLEIATHHLTLLPPSRTTPEKSSLLSFRSYLQTHRRLLTSSTLLSRIGDLHSALTKIAKGLEDCVADIERVGRRTVEKGCGEVVLQCIEEGVEAAVEVHQGCKDDLLEVEDIQRQLLQKRPKNDPLHMFELPKPRLSIKDNNNNDNNITGSRNKKSSGRTKRSADVIRRRPLTFEEKQERLFTPRERDYAKRRAEGSC